jgi:hypothetical protein
VGYSIFRKYQESDIDARCCLNKEKADNFHRFSANQKRIFRLRGDFELYSHNITCNDEILP